LQRVIEVLSRESIEIESARMHVNRISSSEQLSQLARQWNYLSRGVPFRSFEWLNAWWRHYAAPYELYVLTVHDFGGVLVGTAPLLLEHCGARGRVLQLLGSGEVCSDYLSVLSTPEHEEQVVAAVARWLSDVSHPNGAGPHENGWDLIELSGVDACDSAVAKLVEHMVEEGHTVHRQAGMNCWRIELPATWDEYLSALSKSHRKQVRRVERNLLDTGRAVLRTADSSESLAQGMQILVDLHQRRRRSLRQAGCFASQRFSAFLHEVAERFLHGERLQLHWIELDGQPVAAEFQLAGGDVTYAYQAGVDPDFLIEEPGRLIQIATLKKAIEDGQRGFDFLRGDEPYKAHWRAQSRPSIELRIVPNRTAAQIRHGIWRAGDTMKHLIKSGLNLKGMR
jgi:CelD/BcsL family acetyltransferase involved in cellulose biosynthesis